MFLKISDFLLHSWKCFWNVQIFLIHNFQNVPQKYFSYVFHFIIYFFLPPPKKNKIKKLMILFHQIFFLHIKHVLASKYTNIIFNYLLLRLCFSVLTVIKTSSLNKRWKILLFQEFLYFPKASLTSSPGKLGTFFYFTKIFYPPPSWSDWNVLAVLIVLTLETKRNAARTQTMEMHIHKDSGEVTICTHSASH